MSFISLSKRFLQKSNLLRLIFFLSTESEFHFHGIKSLRFLRIPLSFFTHLFSVIIHWALKLPINRTSFLCSVIRANKNINHSLFNIYFNTYSYELANSVSKFQADTGEGLTQIRNFRDIYFFPKGVSEIVELRKGILHVV